MNTKLVFLHALSPLHCGTGQAIGGIDLPIAREKPTNIPFVPGSSLKGVLRAGVEDKNEMFFSVFGPETKNAADYAGSVQFSDLNLLFLPVRSVKGTFAYVTSPYMLRRLQRDARETGLRQQLPAFPTEPTSSRQVLLTSPRLASATGLRVVFEDLDFDGFNSPPLREWALKIGGWAFREPEQKELFVDRVCMVHDDVMALLLETCTEITARNKLKADTKTVEKGGLWTEESLPVESVLAGLVVASPVTNKDGRRFAAGELLDYVDRKAGNGAFQVGGKASIGRGLCRVKTAG